MVAPASFPDCWAQPARIDPDEQAAEHEAGGHDHHPQPDTCPAC
jgi:hypothetical protein